MKIRRRIHRHPELAYQEYETSRLVADYLADLGYHVRTQVAGTGVVALSIDDLALEKLPHRVLKIKGSFRCSDERVREKVAEALKSQATLVSVLGGRCKCEVAEDTPILRNDPDLAADQARRAADPQCRAAFGAHGGAAWSLIMPFVPWIFGQLVDDILIQAYIFPFCPLYQGFMKGLWDPYVKLPREIISVTGFGYRKSIFKPCFNPCPFGILDHFYGIWHVITLGDTPGQVGDFNDIPAFFRGIKNYRVFQVHVVINILSRHHFLLLQ